MNKNLIFGLVALLLLVACGVVEVLVLKADYKHLHKQVDYQD